MKINNYSSFVVADIPGLIPGASKGVGLGIDFLKHLSRVEILLHLIDLDEGDLKEIKNAYLEINKELTGFSEELNIKEQWVVISKMDKIPQEKRNDFDKEINKLFSDKNVFCVSSFSNEGLERLVSEIGNRLKNEKN